MDNYEFFHHDANATAKNNKRDENEIESAWKEYRKMMSLTNDEEIELLTTPKGLKGKNDNVDNRNDKRDDDKDGYAKKGNSAYYKPFFLDIPCKEKVLFLSLLT